MIYWFYANFKMGNKMTVLIVLITHNTLHTSDKKLLKQNLCCMYSWNSGAEFLNIEVIFE